MASIAFPANPGDGVAAFLKGAVEGALTKSPKGRDFRIRDVRDGDSRSGSRRTASRREVCPLLW